MAKILMVDIETAPNLAWIWKLWDEVTSTEMIEREWYILCWCCKWLDNKEIISSALVDFPSDYKKNKENDKKILEKLWKLLDEADIVCGHNALNFDIKKINARFIAHDMTPPSPYKVIDTLLTSRHYFDFTSNKLNDLARYLKVGAKVDTGGFKLWKQCMDGDLDAWKKMVHYCANDVKLLEKVYLKLRPYIFNHPNMNVYIDDDNPVCPKCGSTALQKRGFAYSDSSKFQRCICTTCGAWGRFKKNLFKIGTIKVTN